MLCLLIFSIGIKFYSNINSNSYRNVYLIIFSKRQKAAKFEPDSPMKGSVAVSIIDLLLEQNGSRFMHKVYVYQIYIFNFYVTVD